jgi:dTDP-4-amino-4,6-dideoxygalactose transaminase
MAGAELIGKEEFEQIKRLFEKSNVNLYRYGQNNFLVNELEEKFADYMEVKYAHLVSSGTAAIHSSLAACDIAPGDEVITSAYTFVAPIEAIAALGATPIPVNIDSTYHLDPIEVEKHITNKTKAIVCIPMWAAPHMDQIVKIAHDNNLKLIEDSAQALGAKYKGKKLGTFGDIGSFSFDAGKTLHTGEGGIIITDNKDLYDKAAEFSDHGHMHKENLPRGLDPRRKKGLNLRMSELTAAIGIAQLNKIDFILSESKKNKEYIKSHLLGIPNISFREFSDEGGSQGDTLIFNLSNSDTSTKISKFMEDKGLGTKILPEAFDWHYAGAWEHIFKEIEYYNEVDIHTKWKSTENLLRRSICINIPINITKDRCDQIINIIKEGCNKYE